MAESVTAGCARRQPWHRRGALAWGVLTAWVIAWNLTSPDEEEMSEVFRRNRMHALPVWAYVTLHLSGLLPERLDPLHLSLAAWRSHRRAGRR